MAVTNVDIKRESETLWKVIFTSDDPDPTFRVYLNGELVGTTTENYWYFDVALGDEFVVEVLDQTEGNPTPVFGASAVLGWDGREEVATYLLEQYNGATWDSVVTIKDTGASFYTWETPQLTDQTSYRYRVTPTGDNGEPGTAIEFQFLMVRNPPAPDVTMVYESVGRTVTISAAA